MAPGSTQTTKRGRGERLIKVGLDLETPAPDTVRLEPMDLGPPDAALREEPDMCVAFELPPAAFAITFCEVPKDSNAPPDRDDFDLGDFADDLEVHAVRFYRTSSARRPASPCQRASNDLEFSGSRSVSAATTGWAAALDGDEALLQIKRREDPLHRPPMASVMKYFLGHFRHHPNEPMTRFRALRSAYHRCLKEGAPFAVMDTL